MVKGCSSDSGRMKYQWVGNSQGCTSSEAFHPVMKNRMNTLSTGVWCVALPARMAALVTSSNSAKS